MSLSRIDMRIMQDRFANPNRKEVILCTPKLSRPSPWSCHRFHELWLAVAEATVVVALAATAVATVAEAVALAVAAALDAGATAAVAVAASSLHIG